MPWIDVADRAALARCQWMEVTAGSEAILLFDFAGEVYATAAICAHHSAWLARGSFDGCGECPRHRVQFRFPTAEELQGPPCGDLRSYPARVAGNRVLIEI